ncbi:MAG TPA: glycosyltransferase, partial [Defluviitaleaceae bacterium]|nr:glycosyltransferase [Defluviitaleaceae bacterium]
MKVVFFHDHRIVNYKNKNYSNGSFSDEVFNRYTNVFGHITFYSRNVLLDKMEKKLSQIINEKVDFIGIKDFSNFLNYKTRYKFNYQIETSDAIIVRLPSILGHLAIRKAKQKCKPYLIELVGCPWDAYWNHSWKGKLVAPFMRYATKKAVRNAPYVLYVTTEFLQRRYPSTGKTIGCSDVALPTLNESVLEARLHKIKQMTKHKPIVIGTTAAVDVRYKGQEYVIQAIAELNKQGYNFEYRLVGGGDKTYLQSIAENYGVADKVIFEGSIPHEKVFDYLDSIDIYVQPSKTEGLPRALIEAMSRGC